MIKLIILQCFPYKQQCHIKASRHNYLKHVMSSFKYRHIFIDWWSQETFNVNIGPSRQIHSDSKSYLVQTVYVKISKLSEARDFLKVRSWPCVRGIIWKGPACKVCDNGRLPRLWAWHALALRLDFPLKRVQGENKMGSVHKSGIGYLKNNKIPTNSRDWSPVGYENKALTDKETRCKAHDFFKQVL